MMINLKVYMFIIIASAAWFYFTVNFVMAFFKRDISFIDVSWGPAFTWLSFILLVTLWPNIGQLQFFVAALVGIWSLRLAIYLHGRNKLKGEDPRYTELAKNWKGHYWLNAYFRVFMIQMLLFLLVAFPIIVVMYASPQSLTLVSILAGIIALSGLGIEAMADFQMSQFQKMKPRPSKFCRQGLWKYSRHPNYFGEIVFWFGVALAVCPVEYGYIGFLGPVFLTFLLLKVSGVPMLENKYKDHPEWPAYESQTRVLLPLPK